MLGRGMSDVGNRMATSTVSEERRLVRLMYCSELG